MKFCHLCLIALACFYSVKLCNLLDKLIYKADQLPETEYDFINNQNLKSNINDIRSIWDGHNIIFNIFVDEHYHSSIELALQRLEDYSNGDNFQDYLYAKSVFISSLEDLKNVEGRDFFSVF